MEVRLVEASQHETHPRQKNATTHDSSDPPTPRPEPPRKRPVRTYGKRKAAEQETTSLPPKKRKVSDTIRVPAESGDSEDVEQAQESEAPSLPPQPSQKRSGIMRYFRPLPPASSSSAQPSVPSSDPTLPADTPPSSPPTLSRHRPRRRLTTRPLSDTLSPQGRERPRDTATQGGLSGLGSLQDGGTSRVGKGVAERTSTGEGEGREAPILSDRDGNAGLLSRPSASSGGKGPTPAPGKKPPKPPTLQLTLNLGLTPGSGGFTLCEVCDMLYNPVNKNDVKVHAKQHALVCRGACQGEEG